MYQKDYILRMIEMIGEFIAALLGFLKKGEIEKAEEILDNAYYDFLKEDAAYFRKIPKDKLTRDLLEKHNYTNNHLEILSELFYAEAELANAKKKMSVSLEYYEKSLILLEFIVEESRTFSIEKSRKADLLKSNISRLKKNGET